MSDYESDVGEASREYAVLKRNALAGKRAKAVELANKGESLSNIAERLGVAGKSVGRWLRAAGVDYRHGNKGGDLARLADGVPT